MILSELGDCCLRRIKTVQTYPNVL